MAEYVTNSYFKVSIGDNIIGMSGEFTMVSGLSVQYEYETYNEGGSNFPRRFFKNVVPQNLVLTQGTVTDVDRFSAWFAEINAGIMRRFSGIIELRDHTATVVRTWVITEAIPVRYDGPSLDSMQTQLAVSRIEFSHNGCV